MTRLLVQGNSGSGKSHLLRRVMEESAGLIQQVIIDPEGDYVTLAETFGHTVIEAASYDRTSLIEIGGRARHHRASVVLDLSSFKPDEKDARDITEMQMDAASAFLGALFDAPRGDWHPCLVFVDEAQLFAPSSNASLDIDKAIKKRSVTAVLDLMCRGRKRGLAGILATQRLAKLSTSAAAEASNFLLGRTFFDADIERAGDMLGMKPSQARQIADLERGQFIGLGPAIARRALRVNIGATVTRSPNAPASLTLLPDTSRDELAKLILPPSGGGAAE